MPKPNGPNADFVSGWLEQLGLSSYLQAFLDNDIDAGNLAHLTSTDLVELGVASVGHRRRLLDAIARLAVAGQVQRPDPEEKPPAPGAPGRGVTASGDRRAAPGHDAVLRPRRLHQAFLRFRSRDRAGAAHQLQGYLRHTDRTLWRPRAALCRGV